MSNTVNFKQPNFETDKIKINQLGKAIEITISGKIAKDKFISLSIWFVLWTIAGIAVISQLPTITDESTRTFVWVWLAFWAYFFYRTGKAVMWRKMGAEKITIDAEHFTLINDVPLGSKGWKVEMAQIRNFTNLTVDRNNFVANYFESFWVVGGETIGFYADGKLYSIAKQIPKNDVEKLKSFVEYIVSKYQGFK